MDRYISLQAFELGYFNPGSGMSVESSNRVGVKPTITAYRSIAKLKLEYAQFEELETFAPIWATRLDETNSKNHCPWQPNPWNVSNNKSLSN